MGISLESWRGQLGRWERRRRHSPNKAKGILGLLQKMHWNGASQHIFILIAAFIHAFKSLQERFRRKMTANQMELFVVQLVLCLSARITEIASSLMHDIETQAPAWTRSTKSSEPFVYIFIFRVCALEMVCWAHNQVLFTQPMKILWKGCWEGQPLPLAVPLDTSTHWRQP